MSRRRPLLIVACVFAGGIVFGRVYEPMSPPSVLILFTLLGSGIAVLSFTIMRLRAFSAFFVLFVCTVLGMLLYTNARFPVEQLSEHIKKIQHIHGIVMSYPDHGPERTSFVLQPVNAPGRLQVFYDHTRDSEYFQIDYGDELIIRAPVRVPPSAGLSPQTAPPKRDRPGERFFDYRDYLKRRDIWGVMWVFGESQVRVLARRQGDWVLQIGYDLRQKLFAQIKRHLPNREGSLLKGLLFGEREGLSKELTESFRNAGVMHVLAVSGANLGMILALLALVLNLWGFSVTRLYVIASPVVLLYLLVVGFEVSLLRTTVMFFFLTVGFSLAERGWMLKRWADPLQGLATAALVILCFDPEALFEESFQLSFAGTLGILLVVLYVWPRLSKHPRLKPLPPHEELLFRRAIRATVMVVLVSLAAQLAVAPVIAYQFHRVYLWGSILGNLVIVPLVTIAVWGGIALLVISAIPVPLIASVIAAFEGLLLTLIIRLSEFFAQLPGAAWSF